MLKNTHVQHKNTKVVKEKQQTFMSTGVYSFSPLWQYLPQPFTKYRYERASPLTQVCVFLSTFFVIFLIYFSYFLSRLKQVSLSFELEMRYTTAPCLTGTPHFFNQH